MAKLNMDSIMKKAKSYMNSSDGRAATSVAIEKITSGKAKGKDVNNHKVPDLEEVAQKYIDVLQSTINSSGLPSNVIDAISSFNYKTTKIPNSTKYVIEIWFSSDLSRPSLYESKYGSISNIAALYNNGVEHTMEYVYGYWHNHEVRSRNHIPSTHFMQNAKINFMSRYADECNVISVIIDDIYS